MRKRCYNFEITTKTRERERKRARGREGGRERKIKDIHITKINNHIAFTAENFPLEKFNVFALLAYENN